MAQQIIVPIVPNYGMQESAVAGSSAVIFTSTDRKIIKERAGEIDPKKSFKEIFAEKSLSPKVENEESTARPEVDIKELEERQREHFKILKDSPIRANRDKVEAGEAGAGVSIAPAGMVKETEDAKQAELEKVEIGDHTARIIMELNLKPEEVMHKFELDEKDLYETVLKIKELHLKRIIANTREEFEKLSEAIKKDTLAAIKPQEKEWMIEQLEQLRKGSAEYKLKLLNSLKTMGLNSEQEKNIVWLEKIVSA